MRLPHGGWPEGRGDHYKADLLPDGRWRLTCFAVPGVAIYDTEFAAAVAARNCMHARELNLARLRAQARPVPSGPAAGLTVTCGGCAGTGVWPAVGVGPGGGQYRCRRCGGTGRIETTGAA